MTDYSLQEQVQTSTLAIVSLVSGILSWVLLPFVGSIVAVITGHMAKREIRESLGKLSGDGMATAGLILGYVQLALTVLGICGVILFLIFMFTVAGSTWSYY
ncbi:MAG: DUF4190 domain-containing protein [Anaerolineales bacterium]|nr:DUF4190 domain-containing protein [Anaerolineales bacterium]